MSARLLVFNSYRVIIYYFWNSTRIKKVVVPAKSFYRRSYLEVTYLHTLRADFVKEGFHDKAFQSVTNILLSEPKFRAVASVVLLSPVPCKVFHFVTGLHRFVRMYV